MTTAPYEVHDADIARDREDVLSVWSGNLGSRAHMSAKYDWFYLGCPEGLPVLSKLRHVPSNEWIGTVAAGRRRMLLQGKPLVAALMVDFAVSPQHRSFGPALTLKRKAMARAADRFDLLYAFPNERASPIYQRAGYKRVGEAVRHARVLRHGAYLRRRMPQALAACAGMVLDAFDRVRLRLRSPAVAAEWCDRATADMDRLWTRSAHGDALLTVRDSAYLQWRLDRSPFAETRYLLLRDASGELEAWFACQALDNGVLNVYDFWSADAVSGIARHRIDALLREARRQGHAVVWFEFAGTEAALAGWRAAGFRPRASRPVFMHSRTIPADTLAMHLHLTGADEDE